MAKQKTEAQLDRFNRYGSPLQWLGAVTVGAVSSGSTFINLVRTKFHDDNAFRQGFSVLNETKNDLLRRLGDDQISAAMEVIGKHTGDHPDYLDFQEARSKVNELFAEAKKNALSEGNIRSSMNYRNAVQEYDEVFSRFSKSCREGIDKAMQTKDYDRLAKDFSKQLRKIKSGADHNENLFAEAAYGIRSEGLRGYTQGVWQRFSGFGSYTQRNMLFKTAVALGVGFGGTMMVFNQLNTRDKLNEIDKQSENTDRKLDALLEKAGVDETDVATRAEHRARVKQRDKAEDSIIRQQNRSGHAAKLAVSRAEADASKQMGV